MLIAGALSGIQSYLFDVAHEGGRQARRLRARSLFIQIVAECAALRLRHAAGWGPEAVIISGAGKVLLSGADLSPAAKDAVISSARDIARWLLANVGSELRFQLALDEGEGSPAVAYGRVMRQLHAAALQTLPGTAMPRQPEGAVWVLEPVLAPCAICHRRSGERNDLDEDTGEPRLVCRRCEDDLAIGGRVIRANYLVLRCAPRSGDDIDVLGYGVSFGNTLPDDDYLVAATLREPDDHGRSSPKPPPERRLSRRVARHTPDLEFMDLAEHALGAPLLAVLRMDVDSLGSHIDRTLTRAQDFLALRALSADLDEFFSTTLDAELSRPEWNLVYTIFSGGDDLLLVGPWSLMLSYAGHVQRLFSRHFPDLTLSAGVALIKPKRPIRHAAFLASERLEDAKTKGRAPKDQCAALGEIWKWSVHRDIIDGGQRLAGWVENGLAQRAWLHTLLELSEARMGGDAGATARLAYHVARNYPSERDPHPHRAALRQWADRIVDDFDTQRSPETWYLPAIVRYALLATRRRDEERSRYGTQPATQHARERPASPPRAAEPRTRRGSVP
jgi:CRISPR-associated protein Csm1